MSSWYPTEYMSHPKVMMARKLMFEAEKELKTKEFVTRGKDKCVCGHIRKSHGPSHSINYTGGFCHRCKNCHNFMMK